MERQRSKFAGKCSLFTLFIPLVNPRVSSNHVLLGGGFPGMAEMQSAVLAPDTLLHPQASSKI